MGYRDEYYADPNGYIGKLVQVTDFEGYSPLSVLLEYDNGALEEWNIKDVEKTDALQLSLF